MLSFLLTLFTGGLIKYKVIGNMGFDASLPGVSCVHILHVLHHR